MRKFFVGAIVALSWAPFARAQSIVYDNTTTSLNNNLPLLPPWLNDSVEAGDEIWLGGTARQATELKLLFNYRGTVPGTFDARVRFRSYDLQAEGPGAVFYETGLIQGLTTVSGINEYSFAIPNVVVPDRFVWTVQLYNRQGSDEEFGPAYYNPPTVGYSADFFWQGAGNEWTPYSWGADPYANFGARLTAVPEPSSLCAVVGALAILRRRASSRNRH